MPGRWHLGDRYTDPPEGAFASRAAALEWLGRERPNLAAVAQEAHDTGLHAVTWQLAEAMWPHFLQRKHYPSWIRTYELGLAAAEACGDPRAQARMLEGLGIAHNNLQDFGGAADRFGAALALERQAATASARPRRSKASASRRSAPAPRPARSSCSPKRGTCTSAKDVRAGSR
ncbi:hypothetical protein [Actinomadura madurae]|uniref:hypothetical protein n=1 Tax=Actinomadura madurae TaxID=1993 RepID=UPI0020D22EC3|nr:hypothetical protein [Actinomadura madurae]MCQ0015450.1 hypothetical protein [Actinomadura madurae]